MIRSGNYIIIPVEVSSFVLEVKEDKLALVGEARGHDMEAILNDIREALVGYATREKATQEHALRSWKRFNATKEFMSEYELKFNEEMWKDFNLNKFVEQSKGLLESYDRGLFEVTDLMLEYNIPVHSVTSEDREPVKEVSLQDVSKMLGNLGSNKDDDNLKDLG